MNKNIIYTIDIDTRCVDKFKSSKFTSRASSWYSNRIQSNKLLVEMMQKYADRTNSDFIQLTNDNPLGGWATLPKCWSPFQHACWCKFTILNHFANSSYDTMLYLDQDVLIRNNAKNIFTEVECEGIHMRKLIVSEAFEGPFHTGVCREHFKLDVIPDIYNGGVIYANKSVIQKFCNAAPKSNEWAEFICSVGLTDEDGSSISNYSVHTCDQIMTAIICYLNNIAVTDLDRQWNKSPQWQRAGTNFVHYHGSEGKTLLTMIEPVLRKHGNVNFTL